MATLLLSAAGSAFGGAMGGTLAGVGTAALGKAAGATLGSTIDQRLLGLGAMPTETGRVERFRVMGSGEGAVLPRIFGRCRVAGHVIWSSRFLERSSTERIGGKGGASARSYRYSVSLAIALCEGQVARIGRIWADGQPIDQSALTMRLYPGSDDQLPDPLITAIEMDAPAYRGTAYVVFEDLDLAPFGNRIPQFNFEVFRLPAEPMPGQPRPPAIDVRGVALVPGTGEYALATEPVVFRRGMGRNEVVNVHNDRGLPDLVASLDQLAAELPNARSVSLVATWFGDDLRCDRCNLYPAVEQRTDDGAGMPWCVSGQERAAARTVSRVDGRPVFGGSPADASVLQAIARIRAAGQSVMFYPFILMDIQTGNGRADPWTGAADQPPVPWRGRITLAEAPGRPGSTDRTATAADEVAAFFGRAERGDFEPAGTTVRYSGPEEWSYRRFILHYANLCALAGGVDAFCIGSELRSLTQIRDTDRAYPAVRELQRLAADVRTILGSGTKLGYAADWSEYFGHHPADGSGDVLFHLDPLWASADIDFIGIDNYMPISDWRDGNAHADAGAGSIYDLTYLTGNVASGEGYDWYYSDQAGRDAQQRLPIVDGAYGEDWTFRYKDLLGWWSNAHFDRLGGAKAAGATAWVPKSKPIWFTELGCPAVDKGTNQPNVFYDVKSSESALPYHSTGGRDEFIQHRYLQAMFGYWNDAANNPVSEVYGGRMVDMARAFVWAWDARPWPDFPDRLETWADGGNHAGGHWLNGRMSNAGLADVVSEIALASGLYQVDVAGLHGAVTGYLIEGIETGRQSLQPLMLGYGFDSFAQDEALAFANRAALVPFVLDRERLVVVDGEPVSARTRSAAAELPRRLALSFVRADLDYAAGAVEAQLPEALSPRTEAMSLPLVLTEDGAQAVAERALEEARVAGESFGCALPPSLLALGPGDAVAVDDGTEVFRIDRIELAGHLAVSGVRIRPALYEPPVLAGERTVAKPVETPGPVEAVFLDLPLLTGSEAPCAPHIAVVKVPWTGPVAVYSASEDAGYSLEAEIKGATVIGELLEDLPAGRPGLWMRRRVRVRLARGRLESRSALDVLNGANAAALRFGEARDWEIIQFRTAELVAEREYELDMLLRGQAGTDFAIAEVWPAGTDFVLLDGTVEQVPFPPAARGLPRHFRVGPAARPYDDHSYVHLVETVSGAGLRPFRPVHLRASRAADGAVGLDWVRRSRIDGDSWLGREIPVGEDTETYLLRLLVEGEAVREVEVDTPSWNYAQADQVADGVTGKFAFEVAQISARFGPGPFGRMEFDG